MIDTDPIFTTFLKKEQITADAWTFSFKKPKGFKYTAGQYIKIKLPINAPDSRGVSRYFTLSSSPTEEFLSITTRIMKSSFKIALSEISQNSRVEMRGPWGDFVLDISASLENTRDRQGKQVVMIAGGIGLTPYRSMIKYVVDMKLPFRIIMIVSYRNEKDILFKEELEGIQKKNNNIQIVTTISEPGASWRGDKGRINIKLLQKKLASFNNKAYYIAGPDPMIAVIARMLGSEGVVKDQILTDGFPGYT